MRKLTVLLVVLLLGACSQSGSDDGSTQASTVGGPPQVFAALHESLTSAPAELYVPARYAPAGPAIDLVVHFHGASSVTEREHDSANKAAALVSVNYSGLSAAYQAPFSNAALLQQIIDEALTKTAAARGIASPLLGKLVLSSFSAGYAAIREILKTPAYVAQTSDIVLADSLHAGYVSGQPNPAQMADFAAFAQQAAATNKGMWIAHSSIVPGSYASTTETADYLIAQIGATRVSVSIGGPYGMLQTSDAALGRFHVQGYVDNTAQDHINQLQYLRALWMQTSLGVLP